MRDNKKVVIAGAGVAGLTLAYSLSRAGHDVMLVEKEDRVGGLARSYSYDGFVFDIGPHRFHSDMPEVNSLIHEVLGDDCRMIARKSGVQMFGTYFDWPLGWSSLFKMPLSRIVPIAFDLFRKQNRNSGNFEDYIVSRYGQTLYEIFFKPYTEKFLRMACSDISHDWAITGIDRAVIDKKAQFNDLLSLAKTLLGAKPATRFVYPKSGGIQVFCDILQQRIIENGGRVLTGSRIERIDRKGMSVTGVVIGGEAYPCEELVWTAPINGILSLLGEPRADLSYLSLILYNYRLDAEPHKDYQWCYFGSSDIPFNRVSIPSQFNPSLAPAGKSGVCVEVTCMKGDEFWEAPQRIEPVIREKLCAAGVIRDGGDISGYNIEKVEHAYPIYSLEYRSILDGILQRIGRYRNLRLLGRTGAFWYNNMDHSIEAALALHRGLTGKRAGFEANTPDLNPQLVPDVTCPQSLYPHLAPASPVVLVSQSSQI